MAERVKLAVELPREFVPLVGVSEEALPTEIEKLLALGLVRQGAFWTLGAEMEVWYRHDGTQWVQDTPVGEYRVKEPYRLS